MSEPITDHLSEVRRALATPTECYASTDTSVEYRLMLRCDSTTHAISVRTIPVAWHSRRTVDTTAGAVDLTAVLCATRLAAQRPSTKESP